MMVASLRAAATRILRPAVLPGARVRWLVHTQQQQSEPHLASQIKNEKEELYNLIAEADANSATTWFDRRLLKDLSTQVEPRPYDPQWRKIIASKVVTTWTFVAGLLVASGLTVRWLADDPEIVEYNGYLVTAESLPVLPPRECTSKTYISMFVLLRECASKRSCRSKYVEEEMHLV